MRWADAQRLEGWAGEVRVNLIRLAAIIIFYSQHLLNVHWFREDPAPHEFHLAVTAIVLAWSAAVVGLHFCLSRRWAPPALKFVATGWDLVMLTSLSLIGEGPRSPLLSLYFLVIAAAAIRLSLPLVYTATLGSMAAYLILLGHYVFFKIGADRYYADADLRIPRINEIIFLLALGTAGLLAGQSVRQARRLVEGYPVTVAATDEE